VDRSALGPFGLLVVADQTLSELTPIFFRPVNTTEGIVETYFCADETRFVSQIDLLNSITEKILIYAHSIYELVCGVFGVAPPREAGW